jgi:glycosyltransferase involved in cell wall biosynthesis
MRFSVVIANYNYGRYLSDSIRSALEQTDGMPEVVVVDDGSTDHSRDVLASFGDRITAVLQENQGQTAATNHGLGICGGDVICLLDADDLMKPDRLTRLRQAYSAHPDVDWVFHGLQHIDRETMCEVPTPALTGFTRGIHDLRLAVAGGATPMSLPATSGLSWRAGFLRGFLPVPADVISADNYLKFLSMASGVGYVISDALSLQGLHDNQMYTQAVGAERDLFRARNALYMIGGYRRHPQMHRLSDSLLGSSIFLSRFGWKFDAGERRLLADILLSLPKRRAFRVAGRIAKEAALKLKPTA